MNPEIAVLMPVYDRQERMEETIASLNNQGILYDLIIVDDGSRPQLIPPKNPSRGEVVILTNEFNKGIVAALNLGLKYIQKKGYKYIARIDAGDLSYPNRLKIQKDYLDKHKTCMLLGSQVRLVDKDKNSIGTWKIPVESKAIKKKIHYRTCFVHSAVMIRRTVLEKVGYYNNKYPHAEDYELFMRISQKFECSNLTSILLDCEFMDSDSISRKNQFLQSKSILNILRSHFEWNLLESYLGLFKNAVLLYIPANYRTKLKMLFWSNFGI